MPTVLHGRHKGRCQRLPEMSYSGNMHHPFEIGFHVVRSTKPCVLISSQFIPPREFCCPRDPSHVAKNPEYPHPSLYLTQAQKYMFRHQRLRHLRIEQDCFCSETCAIPDFCEIPTRARRYPNIGPPGQCFALPPCLGNTCASTAKLPTSYIHPPSCMENHVVRNENRLQLVRYFSSSSGASKSEETNEDTTAPDDEAIGVDVHHRSPNFNSFF